MTTSGHSGDQGGEHGGAMDKLKSVWREAVGSREDETRAEENQNRDDAWGSRPAPSGTAHPADVRPDLSARNASGMQPAGDSDPATRQLPQQGAPQRGAQQVGPGPVPRQQQAPPAQAEAQQEHVRQEQPVAAGAPAGQGAPARGGVQAPPAPAGDDRAQQIPRQSGPPQGSAPSAVAQQAGAPTGQQEAPERSAPGSAWSEPDRSAHAGDGGATTTDRRDDEEQAGGPDSAAERAAERGADDRGTVEEARGRHELSGGAAGAATAAGVASAGSRTDQDTTGAGQVRPDSNGAAAATAGAAGAQDVPADPDKFVPAERAESFAARWAEVKGEFVDEPRDAVHKADALVGEVLDEIAKVFTEHRSRIEHDLDTDDTSTEDLRQALHRYRKFFERLLNI
jgi:hypothetical protein